MLQPHPSLRSPQGLEPHGPAAMELAGHGEAGSGQALNEPLEPLDELDDLGKAVRSPDRPGKAIEDKRAPRTLLSGEWRHLCFFNYAVPPQRLEHLVPEGVELDTRNGDAFLSLVALDFLDLHLFGVAVPRHRRFSQINLRFYVRDGARRGVGFLRELVPKRLLAYSARLAINEPYRVAKMRSEITETAAQRSVEHHLQHRGKEQWLAVHADPTRRREQALENERFFLERHWSFNRSRLGKLLRFQVHHPIWPTLPVERYELDWDFGALYGEEWEWMSHAAPHSVLLAEGSPIEMSFRPALPLTR